MPNLTDTQLVILSAAAQRDDRGVLPLPKSLKAKGGAATTVLKSLLKKGLVEEVPAERDTPAWRKAEGSQRMTLIITSAGFEAIGIEAASGPGEQGAAAKPQPKKRRQKTAAKARDRKSNAKSPGSAARTGTKQALLIDLLNRKGGATIAEAVVATGWQPHSIRGAISGTLKKKLGLAVASEKVDGRGRVYRIAARS